MVGEIREKIWHKSKVSEKQTEKGPSKYSPSTPLGPIQVGHVNITLEQASHILQMIEDGLYLVQAMYTLIM